jgi:uncharacterized protein involved in outer membrane biogenesis
MAQYLISSNAVKLKGNKMKKIILIVAVIVALFLVAAIALPIIFKDDIKAKVNQQINESLNADVYFNDFGLSLFRSFPHATASLYDFGIVNKAPFDGDTLISVNSFRITINLWSLFSDQIKINKIELNEPQMVVMVLENGVANYNIMLEEEEAMEEEATEFSVSIDRWVVNNGKIIYLDLSTNVLVRMNGVYHEGKGDLTQDVFDMNTFTRANSFSASYENVEYITDKKLEADVIMNMNMPEFKFTFKDNKVKLNEFAFGFEGWLAMPEDDIDMDISFASHGNTFKDLLSIVPGMYTDDFKNVKADGSLAFNGFVKGTYSEASEKMPAFNLALQVNDGMVRYPDLPKPISNINMDLLIDVPGGIVENTKIDLKKFHLDFGGNPVDARLLVEGLESMKIDADIDARINLADLNQMIPMEGLTLRGMFVANMKANGVYDSAKSLFPKMDAVMSLDKGYVKTAEFPSIIDNLHFDAKITNPNGQMSQTEVWVNNFGMALDGERFVANLYLKDLDNYSWDLTANGTLDLEKIAKIMELQEMELKGKIVADIKTKGQMADVEAERYDRLPTSGTMSVSDFYFKSEDLPQGFTINRANASFNPDRLNLNQFEGAVGSSDLNLTGYLSNYISYMFKENETLKGEMTLRSNRFNVNEWMTDDATTETDTLELEIVEIPRNVDFVFNSSIKQVVYDNLTLNDLSGKVTVRNSRVNLENLKFRLLEGLFTMTGYYSTENPAKPTFNFRFNVDGLSFQEAFNNFNTVQALAPIAQHIDGKFSTSFTLGGELQPNMMPNLSTLSGQGLVELANAALKDSKIISGITSFASQNVTDEIGLNNIKINAEIRNGRMHIRPFDFKLGNIEAMAQGSNGIDGSLDYNVGMEIPTGQLGQALNQAIASRLGQSGVVPQNVKVNLRVGGTYNDPKIGLASTEQASTGSSVATQAKDAVTEKIEAEKEAIREEVQEQIEEKREEVMEVVEEQKERAKEEVKKEVDKAKDRLRNLLR